MDKESKDLSLLKLRSTAACIRDGYRLYMDNFRKTFRSTWMIACVYAVFTGIVTTLATSLLTLRGAIAHEGINEYLPIILSLFNVLATIALFFVAGRILLKQSGENVKLFSFFPRYMGAALLLLMVVILVTILLILITELPALVLLAAGITSQVGAMAGDATGMPDYMLWMNLAVFTLAGFIRSYIYLSAIFPFFFLAGSVTVQEKERAEMKASFGAGSEI